MTHFVKKKKSGPNVAAHSSPVISTISVPSLSSTMTIPPLVRLLTTSTHSNSVSHEVEADASGIDYRSALQHFGWAVIDEVPVPTIYRKDEVFSPVRILEALFLKNMPQSFSAELGSHANLTSYYVTDAEVHLLNTINRDHTEYLYGREPFNRQDLIVNVDKFREYLDLIKLTFPEEVLQAKALGIELPPAHELRNNTCGWIQVNNTISPYIRRDNKKYVISNVMQHAARLCIQANVKEISPTIAECQQINNLCHTAGFDFQFGIHTKLLSLQQIYDEHKPKIVELPPKNPRKFAKYTETNAQISESLRNHAPQGQASLNTNVGTTTNNNHTLFSPNSTMSRIPGSSQQRSGHVFSPSAVGHIGGSINAPHTKQCGTLVSLSNTHNGVSNFQYPSQRLLSPGSHGATNHYSLLSVNNSVRSLPLTQNTTPRSYPTSQPQRLIIPQSNSYPLTSVYPATYVYPSTHNRGTGHSASVCRNPSPHFVLNMNQSYSQLPVYPALQEQLNIPNSQPSLGYHSNPSSLQTSSSRSSKSMSSPRQSSALNKNSGGANSTGYLNSVVPANLWGFTLNGNCPGSSSIVTPSSSGIQARVSNCPSQSTRRNENVLVQPSTVGRIDTTGRYIAASVPTSTNNKENSTSGSYNSLVSMQHMQYPGNIGSKTFRSIANQPALSQSNLYLNSDVSAAYRPPIKCNRPLKPHTSYAVTHTTAVANTSAHMSNVTSTKNTVSTLSSYSSMLHHIATSTVSSLNSDIFRISPSVPSGGPAYTSPRQSVVSNKEKASSEKLSAEKAFFENVSTEQVSLAKAFAMHANNIYSTETRLHETTFPTLLVPNTTATTPVTLAKPVNGNRDIVSSGCNIGDVNLARMPPPVGLHASTNTLPNLESQISRSESSEQILSAESIQSQVIQRLSMDSPLTDNSDILSQPPTLLPEITQFEYSGRTISGVMHQPNTPYVLLEAIQTLFFPEKSLTSMTDAIEQHLDVETSACTLEEEQAFLQHFEMPWTSLPCKKLIKLSDLKYIFDLLNNHYPLYNPSNEEDLRNILQKLVETKSGHSLQEKEHTHLKREIESTVSDDPASKRQRIITQDPLEVIVID